jgi:hypothetical protein
VNRLGALPASKRRQLEHDRIVLLVELGLVEGPWWGASPGGALVEGAVLMLFAPQLGLTRAARAEVVGAGGRRW